MALPPKFTGQLLTFPSGPSSPSGGDGQAKHTLELYLDYVCPFSAKLFKTFDTQVRPLIEKKYQSKGKDGGGGGTPAGLRVIFRQQIQPWHPSSTLVHEAGAAVLQLAPARFWDFSRALFERQTEYFDESVVDEARNATYRRLAALAGSVIGEGKEQEIFDLLVVGGGGGSASGKASNSGNKVTDDVKFMVKANRLTGVHVTPSVLFNGVMEASISSGWTVDQWDEWLAKNVV